MIKKSIWVLKRDSMAGKALALHVANPSLIPVFQVLSRLIPKCRDNGVFHDVWLPKPNKNKIYLVQLEKHMAM